MGIKYSCLSFEERKNIEILYKKGMSCPKIAKQINRNTATVYREIERNSKGNCYNASAAQANANLNKKLIASQKSRGAKTKARINAYMMANPQAAIKEIASGTNVSYHTARNYYLMLQKEHEEAREKAAGKLGM